MMMVTCVHTSHVRPPAAGSRSNCSSTHLIMATKARWVPDHEVNVCSQCSDEFSIVKRKHHCRVCGRVFCDACSPFRLLIPTTKLIANPSSRVDDPAVPLRTCSHCARSLHAVQDDLRKLLSKAHAALTVHRLSPERYMNHPFGPRSLESDIRQATHTLWNFTRDNALEGRRDRIPTDLLQGAKGLAFLTVAKVGFGFTGRLGTGLVIARLNDGSWSAPSAIQCAGAGWGFQAGIECTDVVLVLATASAVDAFSSRVQVCLGTELAVSMGPVGRSAGTDLHAGAKGASAAFSYAHSRGLFFGISLEASAITSRPDVNRAFYGLDVKPAALLSGGVPRPVAAEPLYTALAEVLASDPSVGASSSSLSLPPPPPPSSSSSSPPPPTAPSETTSSTAAVPGEKTDVSVRSQPPSVTEPAPATLATAAPTTPAPPAAAIVDDADDPLTVDNFLEGLSSDTHDAEQSRYEEIHI